MGNIQKHLPLSEAAYLILWALTSKPMHGYGVIKSIKEQQKGFHMLTGTLYRNIDKMLTHSLIEKVDAPANAADEDARRVYYKATGLGEQVFDAQAERYRNQIALASLSY